MTHYWETHLDDFDKNILRRLGYDVDHTFFELPTDHNPIVRALNATFQRDYKICNFVEFCEDIPWFNKTRIARLASICQMNVYDAQGGPDGDRERKGLRRHWYSWFKTQFAQEFSNQLARSGDKKEMHGFDGTAWAGRLSQTYGDLVDNENVTYKDLWVSDTSRMIHQNWTRLFSHFNAILCVEKDSLFDDFKTASKALGIRALVSGKGKMSKAATELVLRKHFNLDYNLDIDEDHPLYVLTITDWDYDGESSIAPTFAEQCRRYTPHVVEARVGIKPEDGIQNNGPLFELKLNNSGYINWAAEKGLFNAECSLCEHTWIAIGIDERICPLCNNDVVFEMKVRKTDINALIAHGYEVEALPTRAYYGLIVDALLSVLPYQDIVDAIRADCKADNYKSANGLTEKVCKWNPTYRKLMETFGKLEEIKDAFERDARDLLSSVGEDHVRDFEDLEDDPDADELRDYVVRARGYEDAWRPFDQDLRTSALMEWIVRNERDTIRRLKTLDIFDTYGS